MEISSMVVSWPVFVVNTFVAVGTRHLHSTVGETGNCGSALADATNGK